MDQGRFANQRALIEYAEAHDLAYAWEGSDVFAKRWRLAQLARLICPSSRGAKPTTSSMGPKLRCAAQSKNASICRSGNTSVLAKELPNYRVFFLAKIAFQLSL